MGRYLIERIIRGLLSVAIVVALVMVMIYTLMDRNLIFAKDSTYSHQSNNQKTVYKYSKWEEYGYLDYVPYSDYLTELVQSGEMTEEQRNQAVNIGQTETKDKTVVKKYVKQFTRYYEGKGYRVVRLDAVTQGGKKLADGGQQQLFAFHSISLSKRLVSYFANLITIDNIHNVKNIKGKRGLTFTLHDPAYGGNQFAPAILGNGTTHRYMLYVNNKFPYIHQNVLTIHLGTSYAVNAGVDVFETMTVSQGSYLKSTVTYPTGLTEESADDLHTATYVADSLETNDVLKARYTDDYTNVNTSKKGLSKTEYSFVIGIISVLISYVLGVPLGIVMARKKDSLLDQLGTIYVVFIIAVPSLAYIFLFKALGGQLGLPTTFDLDSAKKAMYVLPIISLALPQIADLMKWLRRYMIDQMNSDYVKFARAGGLTENEIFTKHILKNASIPLLHDIPGTVLGALVGAIITESVYVVPGAGNLLTQAINKYDNGVIVGLTLFYSLLSVLAILLGDVLISTVDPRISFSSKDR